MKAMFHFITSYPQFDGGGMEASARRICDHLLSYGDNKVFVYARKAVPAPETGAHTIKLVDIYSRIALILSPLYHRGKAVDKSDIFRAEFLSSLAAVKSSIEAYPDYRHILVSFYISSNGFLAQQIADRLDIPHIASMRGTDFHRDAFSPTRLAAVKHVVERCTFLVVTNTSQRDYARHVLGRTGKTKLIYNAVPPPTTRHHPRREKDAAIHLFSDGGFSHKKGTHLLLQAVAKLHSDGNPVTLTIVGPIEEPDDFWRALLIRPKEYPYVQMRPGVLDAPDLERMRAAADGYVSASLGEGCSLSVLSALMQGCPVISPAVGLLGEPEQLLSNVYRAEPGSVESLTCALRRFAEDFRSGAIVVKVAELDTLCGRFSVQRERESWHEPVANVVPKRDTLQRARQKRLLFYVHDGTGLGHLQRVSKIARAMQGDAACLIISGHRAASWLVPEECEYVHLPSLDSLLPNKSRYWGRKPFLEIDQESALAMRRAMLDAIVGAFDPDAVVTDYLPLGKHDELASVIENRSCKKYFLLRGVLDHPDNVGIDIIGGRSEKALAAHYHRIFVACDRRIIDIEAEYLFPRRLAEKIEYVGYVVEPASKAACEQLRSSRLGRSNSIWVVCSAGGGALGEALIEECLRVAAARPDLVFDIVVGPRSSRTWPAPHLDHYDEAQIRIWQEHRQLHLLHAAADAVICPGGYNSLLEALQGDASIICAPVQLRTNDEQYIHTDRLRRHRPITIVLNRHDLGVALDVAIQERRAANSPITFSTDLNFRGIENIKRQVFADLR